MEKKKQENKMDIEKFTNIELYEEYNKIKREIENRNLEQSLIELNKNDFE